MNPYWRALSLPFQLNTLFLAFLTGLSSTSPIPDDTTTSLTPRSTPGVYICANELWTQPCQIFSPPLAPARQDGLILGPDLPCIPLPYQSSQILSFGPDHDVTCILFRTEACDPAGHEVYSWPGSDYLPGPSNVDLQTGQTGRGFRAYGCRGSIDLA